jgi:hypothetical protein
VEEATMNRSAGPEAPRPGIGPELPSLGGVIAGSILFMTGGLLIFTVIGIPLGIPMFAAGLGLMLTPKQR